MFHTLACSRVAVVLVLVALGLVVPRASGQSGSDPVNLRPQWKVGQTSRYHVWTLRQQNSVTRAGTQTRQAGTVMEITGEIIWQVNKVSADGSASCAMTVDWLTGDLTLPDGSVQRNDTRKARGDSEGVHQLLRAMAGVSMPVEVAADGTITSVRGVDVVKRRAPQDTQVPEELDFIESASDLATLVAAPAGATVGAAWDNRFTWTHQMGKQHQSIKMRLDAVEDIEGIPVAMVSGAGSIRMELDQPPNEPGGPRVNAKQTAGSFETQVMYDLQRHEAVGRNTVTHIGVTITVSIMDRTIVSTLDDHVHSQVLRLAEE